MHHHVWTENHISWQSCRTLLVVDSAHTLFVWLLYCAKSSNRERSTNVQSIGLIFFCESLGHPIGSFFRYSFGPIIVPYWFRWDIPNNLEKQKTSNNKNERLYQKKNDSFLVENRSLYASCHNHPSSMHSFVGCLPGRNDNICVWWTSLTNGWCDEWFHHGNEKGQIQCPPSNAGAI